MRLAYNSETQPSFTNQTTEETLCPVVDAVTGLSAQLQGLLTALSAVGFSGNVTLTQFVAIQKLLGK